MSEQQTRMESPTPTSPIYQPMITPTSTKQRGTQHKSEEPETEQRSPIRRSTRGNPISRRLPPRQSSLRYAWRPPAMRRTQSRTQASTQSKESPQSTFGIGSLSPGGKQTRRQLHKKLARTPTKKGSCLHRDAARRRLKQNSRPQRALIFES